MSRSIIASIIILALLATQGVSGVTLVGLSDFGNLALVNWDTQCSTITQISSISNLVLSTANKCAYDNRNLILYFYATNITSNVKSIYGVDTESGQIISVTPTINYHHFHMNFDPNSGKLVVAGMATTSSNWTQNLVTIGTGDTQFLNTLTNDFGAFLGEGSGLDTINGIQWFPSYRASNSQSYQVGMALAGGIFTVLDPNNGGSPAWLGGKDGTIMGLGYNGSRTIVQWTPSSSTTSLTMGVKSSWDIDYNGQNIYDPTTGVAYSILDNGAPYLDQYIAGINIQTGLTYSAVLVAPDMYPWCSFLA